MALIFSPLTEEALQGPYKPLPKGVFLMLQQGVGTSQIESEMDKAVCGVLANRKLKTLRASTQRGHKDYLLKIIQLIRGCGFGTAIFSEFTPAPTLANIFFEIALCNLLGKPVIIVKSEEAKAPSDFVRTEWVSYKKKKKHLLKQDYSDSVSSIIELATFYETLGDIAMDAEDTDLELAFERYRQSFLINGQQRVLTKLKQINTRARQDDDHASILKPAGLRFRTSISEFLKFLG